jgi:hypothetical protein
MRRWLLVLLACAGLWPVAAGAQTFSVGDHVVIGSTGETGVVRQIGQPTKEGGVMVKVLLDKPGGPTVDDREVWYNSKPYNVTVTAKAAPPVTPPGGTTASGLPMPAKLGDGKTVLLLPGDRVTVGSLGVNGTVVQVLGQLGNGAQMVRVEIDQDAPKYPGLSNIYDTVSSKITPLK